jgi:hypothetical protein
MACFKVNFTLFAKRITELFDLQQLLCALLLLMFISNRYVVEDMWQSFNMLSSVAFAVVQHRMYLEHTVSSSVTAESTAFTDSWSVCGKCYWMHSNDELTRFTKCDHLRFVNFVISELKLLINSGISTDTHVFHMTLYVFFFKDLLHRKSVRYRRLQNYEIVPLTNLP